MSDPLNVLLGDLQYIRSELARNEDIGEKRFGFFVTLVTAVSAGLIALVTSRSGTATEIADEAITVGIAALLVFGLLTFQRLWHRNNVTDHLKGMSDTVRARAVECAGLDAGLHKLCWKPRQGWPGVARAGYAEVVGLVDGALFGALVKYGIGLPGLYAVIGGVAVAAVLWKISLKRK